MPKIVVTTDKSKKYGEGHELLQYDAVCGHDLPKAAQAEYDNYAKATTARSNALDAIVKIMRNHAKTVLNIPGPVDVMVGFEKVTLDAVESERNRKTPNGVKTEKELAGDIARVFGTAKA